MADINEIRFSGTIERLQSITTRTGTPMARWLLKVGGDLFQCVSFGNLASTVLQCQDGDRISLSGVGSINSWKDDKDHWHNDFQVSVWTVDIDGQVTRYQKADTGKQVNLAPPFDDRDPGQFDYSGGSF